MQYAPLGRYGNTVLPVQEILLLAREALKSPGPHSKKVEVFFTDTHHSGAKVSSLDVFFDPIEDDSEDILLGHTESGDIIAFLVGNSDRQATFVFLNTSSPLEQAS